MYYFLITHLVTLNNINLIIRDKKQLIDRISENYLLNIKVAKAF